MSVMVSEVYDAFLAAGAPEAKARAAAEAIPISDQLATKQDIARLETRIVAVEGKVWKAGICHRQSRGPAQQVPRLGDPVERTYPVAPIETTAVTTGTKAWDKPGKSCPVSILRDDKHPGRLLSRPVERLHVVGSVAAAFDLADNVHPGLSEAVCYNNS